ncbi:MAG: TolC family protein [Candidatus Adiutrix sp.]|jgi:outer membrane protein|nr:TolC family protein [Candidatus Adiutrix sp.]
MSMTRFLAAALLAALAAGCADAARQKIALPPLGAAPAPQTIFGQATLTGDGDPAAPPAPPQVPDRPLTLDECLAIAQKVSPGLDSADQAHLGALWSRWQSITAFLPTAGAEYSAARNYDGRLGSRLRAGLPLPTSAILAGQNSAYTNKYSWQVGVSQPLFAGGQNAANYLLARLGVAAADIKRVQAREDLNLAVKQVYFGILAQEKALDVAKPSVVNLKSHLNVAQNFYDVGMAPKNQVLEADVTLAKAVQEANALERELMVSRARLNIFLRRPVDAPVAVADNLKRNEFPLTLPQCLELGLTDSPELKLGRNQVEAASKNVDVARSGFYPTVGMTYVNSSSGDTPRAHSGGAVDWNVAAVASLNVWEWGRTKAEVEKSKVDLNRAINDLTSLEDETRLEVTSNYQSLISNSLNIEVAAKAVGSAAEDLRMVNERYMEQVATNTEVLDAQTRYSQAQYDYYNALYEYNLAWANLERSLGRPVKPSQGQG